MTTATSLHVRAFSVKVRDNSTGAERSELVVLTKEQLQACQIVGQSCKELIRRLCERSGFSVLDIGTPEKREISMNLEELYKLHKRTSTDHRSEVGA